jgi:hypothetical protein
VHKEVSAKMTASVELGCSGAVVGGALQQQQQQQQRQAGPNRCTDGDGEVAKQQLQQAKKKDEQHRAKHKRPVSASRLQLLGGWDAQQRLCPWQAGRGRGMGQRGGGSCGVVRKRWWGSE